MPSHPLAAYRRGEEPRIFAKIKTANQREENRINSYRPLAALKDETSEEPRIYAKIKTANQREENRINSYRPLAALKEEISEEPRIYAKIKTANQREENRINSYRPLAALKEETSEEPRSCGKNKKAANLRYQKQLTDKDAKRRAFCDGVQFMVGKGSALPEDEMLR